MIVRVSGLPGQIAVFPAEMFAGAFTTQDDDDEKWRVIVSVTHASSPIFGPWESADDAAACLETVLMSVGAVTITPETQEPVAQEPEAVECVADGMTHEFYDATGRMYRWHDAERQLNIYDDNGRGLRTIKGININAVTTGPDRFGILYRVGLPAEVGRPTGFVGYDEAVAFAEWLESVGGPKRQRETEPALDTIVVEMSDCLVQVSQAQHALNVAVMKGLLPDRLTGRHVVVDTTGAVEASLVAINEIVSQLYKRDAASIEFIADNESVANTVRVVLGWEDVATLLPVTLVDNSGSKPEAPEPAETGTVADPANVATTDFDGCTYHYNAATGELSKDEGDGPVIVTTVASNTKVYVEQDAEQTYAVVGFIDKARIPFAYLSEAMEFCRWLADRRSHAAINGVEYDIFRQTVLFKVDGVCRCEWDPAASTLVIRFVDGSIQVCTRVTPGVWTPRRLVGRPVGWLDTLTGSEHVVFETEEQAETFVARLAEAFEKGKA